MRKIGIACVNHINGIGYKNNLLYSIPSELSIFKKITTHSDKGNRSNIVVMGKNTFSSLNNKPLKDRFNCVITSQADKLNDIHTREDLKFFNSIESVLEFGENEVNNYNDMFICGGSSIYNHFIENSLLDYLIVSQINNHECNTVDTFFPDYKNKYEFTYIGNLPKNFNHSSCIDEFVSIFIIASFSSGVSTFKGMGIELNKKESPRMDWSFKILKMIGVKTKRIGNHGIKIYGNPNLKLNKKYVLKNYLKDHRLAMNAIILALARGGSWKIYDAKKSILTSFPSFLKIAKSLGGKIN